MPFSPRPQYKRTVKSPVSANIALVYNNSGYQGTQPVTLPNNPSSGNVLLWAISNYKSGSMPAAAVPTKGGGTATIGTAVLDASTTLTSGSDYTRTEIYRIPVTGSGTLEITPNYTGVGFFCGCIEVSGLDAKDGSSYTSTATSASETTGSMTGHAGGLMFGIVNELSSSVTTYSAVSDSTVFSQDNATYFTGICQYRIVSGDESHALTSTIPSSFEWLSLGVVYKKAPVSATAAITGTATASITEADVKAGAKQIVITLTGATWV